MRRRSFITLLGGAAAAWPLSASAQQAGKPAHIGFLGATASVWMPWTAAFVQRLRELGWIEGRNLTIQYRWGEGRSERVAAIADEFVRLSVDVIVSVGSAVAALKQATSVIPVVFPLANDPVGGGLVAGLARPGGNVTGISNQGADLAGKRLKLLARLVPIYAGWRFWPMSAFRTPYLKWTRPRLRPEPSALKSSDLKSGVPRISR